MATLAEQITKDPIRPKLVTDVAKLIDEEVGSKGGLSGLTIKAGYAVIKTLKPGFVGHVVDGLLDDFVGKLEPFYGSWAGAGGGKPFGDHLRPQASQVAEALLSITDERSRRSTNQTVIKLYGKLRPSAKTHVEHAVPNLGRVIEQHLKKA